MSVTSIAIGFGNKPVAGIEFVNTKYKSFADHRRNQSVFDRRALEVGHYRTRQHKAA